jgi:aminocarboxymuconate-semialdehyde decarboxylase
VAAAGPGQVLLGSDYPFDMGSERPVAEVIDAGLPAEEQAKVLAGNAAALGIAAVAALTARTTA